MISEWSARFGTPPSATSFPAKCVGRVCVSRIRCGCGARVSFVQRARGGGRGALRVRPMCVRVRRTSSTTAEARHHTHAPPRASLVRASQCTGINPCAGVRAELRRSLAIDRSIDRSLSLSLSLACGALSLERSLSRARAISVSLLIAPLTHNLVAGLRCAWRLSKRPTSCSCSSVGQPEASVRSLPTWRKYMEFCLAGSIRRARSAWRCVQWASRRWRPPPARSAVPRLRQGQRDRSRRSRAPLARCRRPRRSLRSQRPRSAAARQRLL